MNIRSLEVYGKLKVMATKNVLKHKTIKQGGVWSYYSLGDRYIELITDSKKKSEVRLESEGAGLESEGVGLESESNGLESEGVGSESESNGLESRTKNPSTISVYHNPSTTPIYQSSSIEEQNEEDKEVKSDLDILMKFCNKHNYKLSRKKASSILEAYSLDKVTKAITHIITVKNTSEIDSPGSYLVATLKDIETPKNINITVESKDKPSNFNNFTQRSYDYNKLEQQLLGWDYSEDDDWD